MKTPEVPYHNMKAEEHTTNKLLRKKGESRKSWLLRQAGGTFKSTPATHYNPVRKAPSNRDLHRMEVKERGL